MSDDRDIGYALMGFAFGIWSFFWGFNRLRRKRLIENIPTSTVRGLAMGLVELYGKAKKKTLLKSPLTKTECVLYKYLIEEYRSSGKSGRWVKIASGDSFFSPCCLDDATGRILVFPKGAELIFPVDYEFKTGLGKTISGNLIEFMENNNISFRSWFGNRALRFKEWYIREDEDLYVLGTAKKSDSFPEELKSQLMQRLKELKEDAKKLKEVDLDKDGSISMEEWDAAVAKIERQVLEEALNTAKSEDPADVIIAKGDVEEIFIISDHSEKELIQELSWQCLSGIYGGALLSLATLTYLLFRLKIFCF